MLRYATVYSLRPLASFAAGITRVLLLTALLVGSVQAQDEMDPWEGYNRWMFEFNDASDRILIKPVARGYDAIMPEPARIGVNNFFSNFYDFNGVLNALLQGRIEEALNNTFRVITNSTVGLLGLFDVASMTGIPRYETDFGHTLSIWGCQGATLSCCRSLAQAPFVRHRAWRSMLLRHRRGS